MVASTTSLTVPAVRPPDPAVDGEVGADADEPALLRQRPGHRRVADGPPVGERRPDLGHPSGRGLRLPEHRGRVAAHRADDDRGVRERLRDGVGHQRRRRRPPTRPPLVVGERLGLRRHVEQHLAEVDGLDAVDQDLVGLREHREPAALEPLDEVDLPQRPAAVQRSGHDPGDQLAQLVVAARARAARSGGRGRRGRSPGRRPTPGWRGGRAPAEPLPVARHEGDPVGDQADQGRVVEARVAGLEDLDGRVVHRGRRRLVGQEGQVARPQPVAHRHPLRP